MNLENSVIDIPCPAIPDYLKGRITIVTTCAFEPREIVLFSVAFQCLKTYLMQRGDPFPNTYATLVFTDSDAVTVSIDPDDLGNYAPLIFYPLHKIRAHKCSDYHILAIALEELCHCFLMEKDETKVTHLVWDVARTIFPNLAFYELYSVPYVQP